MIAQQEVCMVKTTTAFLKAGCLGAKAGHPVILVGKRVTPPGDMLGGWGFRNEEDCTPMWGASMCLTFWSMEKGSTFSVFDPPQHRGGSGRLGNTEL
jgi:hypothetical protein